MKKNSNDTENSEDTNEYRQSPIESENEDSTDFCSLGISDLRNKKKKKEKKYYTIFTGNVY